MTREQADKAKEITQNIENVEKITKFLDETDKIIFLGDCHSLFPSSTYSFYSEKINARLKAVIIDTLDTINKELEDELAEL